MIRKAALTLFVCVWCVSLLRADDITLKEDSSEKKKLITDCRVKEIGNGKVLFDVRKGPAFLHEEILFSDVEKIKFSGDKAVKKLAALESENAALKAKVQKYEKLIAEQKTKKEAFPSTGSSQKAFSTSKSTGRVKDVYVKGYYRKDGTYVRPHYRSRPRR